MNNDRYVSPHELPEGYERELLVILQEECAEVIQHVSKALRFGLADGAPGGGYNNATLIARELGHVGHVIDLLYSCATLNKRDVLDGYAHKASRLEKYLQHPPSVQE
jgi:hypothetical protein